MTESSWELQNPCSNWCAKQAKMAPHLTKIESERNIMTKNAGGLYREIPYNLIARGIVIGSAPTCNSDIIGDNYCKQGCNVGGDQLPCAIVRTSSSSSIGKYSYNAGFTNGAGFSLSPDPFRRSRFSQFSQILENTGTGCSSNEKYCCCIDPKATGLLRLI